MRAGTCILNITAVHRWGAGRPDPSPEVCAEPVYAPPKRRDDRLLRRRCSEAAWIAPSVLFTLAGRQVEPT
jgi:hypothetical protein